MSAKRLLDIDARQYDLLQKIIDKVIPGKAVWAYGSRVAWKAEETSDLDLVVFDCDSDEIYTLKEEFDESDLLVSVDVLSWENIPESFKKNIEEKYVVLQKKSKVEGWRKVKLGQVATLNYGKSLPETIRVPGNIPVYSSAGLTGWHNEAAVKSCGIIIGRKGTVGSVHKSDRPFFPIDTVFYISESDTNCDFGFLFYVLSNLGLDNLNSDSAVPGLNRNTAYDQEVFLPPLPEQKAIADVLSSLDDKIDLLHRQNKTLEDLAQALFRKWFIEDEKQGWESKPLDKIADIKSGYSFKSTDFEETGLFRLITIKNVQNGYLDMRQTSLFSKTPDRMPPYCLLNIGDIVLSLTGNVGRVSLIDKENLLLNQRVAKVEPKSQRDHPFLYFFLRNKNTRRVLEEMAKGTAQANLSPIEMKNLKVPFGNADLLKRFSDLTKPWIGKILMNRKQIDALEQTRNTLLPKLMSGTVRVRF